MISIQSLWALAIELGFDPAALLTKTAEKVATDAGGKVAAATGKRAVKSIEAVLSYWPTRDESFREYLRQRLNESNEVRRTAITEAAFEDWAQHHTEAKAELERLLFRFVYLRALIDYCSVLPVLGGTEGRLQLDDVSNL